MFNSHSLFAKMQSFIDKKRETKKIIIFIITLTLFLIIPALANDIFFDNFESGNLSNWLIFGPGVSWHINNTNPHSGIFHAEASPRSIFGTILYKNISLIGNTNITIEYYRKLIGLDVSDEWLVTVANASQLNILESLGSGSANDANYIFKSFFIGQNFTNSSAITIAFMCITNAPNEYCRLDNVNVSGAILNPPDQTPPAISDALINASSPVAFNSFVKVNATVKDNINVSTAIIQYELSNGTKYNITAPNQSSEYYNSTVRLDVIGYWNFTFIANDTNSNNATNVLAQDLAANSYIRVTDQVNPTISNALANVTNPAILNQKIKVNATVTDDIAISNVFIQITQPNNVSYTITAQNNSNEYFNDTIVLNQIGLWNFTFFADDIYQNNASLIAQDLNGNNYINVTTGNSPDNPPSPTGGGGGGGARIVEPEQRVSEPTRIQTPTIPVREETEKEIQVESTQETKSEQEISFWQKMLNNFKNAVSITGSFMSSKNTTSNVNAFLTVLLIMLIIIFEIYQKKKIIK